MTQPWPAGHTTPPMAPGSQPSLEDRSPRIPALGMAVRTVPIQERPLVRAPYHAGPARVGSSLPASRRTLASWHRDDAGASMC